MVRRRSAREVKANVTLRFFERSPVIPSGDPAWAKIQQWQREGKLRLVWSDRTVDGCCVELTEKGKEALRNGDS